MRCGVLVILVGLVGACDRASLATIDGALPSPPVDAVDATIAVPTCASGVTAGGAHSCALGVDGSVWCWGGNIAGQLGTGDKTDRHTPTAVVGLPRPALQITAGGYHTCAILDDHSLWCWGNNASGQLGTNGPDSITPVEVTALTNVAQISAGAWHTCAVLGDGSAWCWGANAEGRLGIGSAGPPEPLPQAVVGLTGPAVEVAAGWFDSCARMADHSTACWGANNDGQLGTGDNMQQLAAVPVVGLGASAHVSVGFLETCAITDDGGVSCWGLGACTPTGDLNGCPTPTLVAGLDHAVDLSLGFHHTCATDASDEVWCWGENNIGQLGIGTMSAPVATPTKVALAARHVAATNALVTTCGASGCSTDHTCAVTTDGSIACWGYNIVGQLGDGTQTGRSSPVFAMQCH